MNLPQLKKRKQQYPQFDVHSVEALQPEWDSAYQNWPPLWRSYHHCVDAARKRNAKRRASSFRQLEVPGGSGLVFNKETREALANSHPKVLKMIRSPPPPSFSPPDHLFSDERGEGAMHFSTACRKGFEEMRGITATGIWGEREG